MSGVVITGDWGQNEVWNQTENCSTSSTPHHLMLFSSSRYFIYFSTLCRLVYYSFICHAKVASAHSSHVSSVPTVHRAAPAVPLCLICRDDSSVLVIATSSSQPEPEHREKEPPAASCTSSAPSHWQPSSQHLNSPLLLLLINKRYKMLICGCLVCHLNSFRGLRVNWFA